MRMTEVDNSNKAFRAWTETVAQDDVRTIPSYIPTEESYQNEIDPKTGLPNGIALRRELRRLVYTHKRNFAVLFIDLNGLKAVNDATGSHDAGDIYIGKVAHKLRTDFAEKDKKFRPNGEDSDEFVVIVEDVHSKEDMMNIGNRVKDKFSGEITVCIGGVFIGPDATDQDIKFAVLGADRAMYDAKTESTRLQQEQNLFCKPTVFAAYDVAKQGPIGMLKK